MHINSINYKTARLLYLHRIVKPNLPKQDKKVQHNMYILHDTYRYMYIRICYKNDYSLQLYCDSCYCTFVTCLIIIFSSSSVKDLFTFLNLLITEASVPPENTQSTSTINGNHTPHRYSIRSVSSCDHPPPMQNNNEQSVGVTQVLRGHIPLEEQKVYSEQSNKIKSK